MDICFIDLTVEFLAVAFHSILYYANVYPKSIFETRRKYSIVVYHSIHPEVNQYIDMCLRSISECFKTGHLSRVVFAITDDGHHPLLKFVFDFHKNVCFDDAKDAYLVQTEQNLRAFLLKLSSISEKFNKLPEDISFTVYLHTNESTAVAITTNPSLEDFPLIENEENTAESSEILPLRSFPVRSYNMDVYMEMMTL
ncbi:mitotic spindle assembly checkpoint protein MAD2B [Galleria mellonella]|uniref:Mitotic spindle assembly checkpoint protein MAD2B n=1 Tax=Galleria mellonella TaxID=7137 RepID=A0A6J1WFQ8_GALME|nr:mitotic spindle assembly checkpoint protein MAD2B [Galleria mellonella]